MREGSNWSSRTGFTLTVVLSFPFLFLLEIRDETVQIRMRSLVALIHEQRKNYLRLRGSVEDRESSEFADAGRDEFRVLEG